MKYEEYLRLPQSLRNQYKISSRYLNINYDAASRLASFWNATPDIAKTVTSSYRTLVENTAAGGAKNSYHMKGMAFDVGISGNLEKAFNLAAFYFNGLGVNRYKNFLHLDTRAAPYLFYYDSAGNDHALTPAVLRSWSWSTPSIPIVVSPLPPSGSGEQIEPGESQPKSSSPGLLELALFSTASFFIYKLLKRT